MSGRGHRVGPVVLAMVAALAAVCLRVGWSGRSDLRTADEARAAGLEDTAIDFYARAARWYLPGIGTQERALAGLVALGRDAETAGRPAVALRCFREARGAILGTRWLLTPSPAVLADANGAIARLTAVEDRAERGDRALSEAGHLALLERDLSPDPWLSALAVLLFLAWVGVLGSGAWRAVLPDGGVRWRVLGAHLGASAVLLAAWLVVLRLA